MDLFLNSNYLILKVIKENEICVKKEKYLSLSQQEVADIIHISKYKLNKQINILIEKRFVKKYNNKNGKYALTKKSVELLKKIENIEKNLEVNDEQK